MIGKTVRLTIISVLLLSSSVVQAAMCALSNAPTGSAYINAFNQGRLIPPPTGPAVSDGNSRGNFGSAPQGNVNVVDCELTGLASDAAPPSPGFTLITSTSQNVPNLNGTTIGTATERVWRKLAATAPVTLTNMCMIGTRASFTVNVLYTSSKYFVLNDIVRGGFSGLGTLDVGYRTDGANGESRVYRIGRTFTSVQHRAYVWTGSLAQRQSNGSGYLDLPTIGGVPSLSINGDGAAILGGTIATATPAQQEAQVSDGWVDFTTNVTYLKPGVSTSRVSGMTYIEFPCGTNTDNAATINSTWRKAGALRLRQTAQEDTTFGDIVLTGYAPPGAIVAVPTP